MYFSPKTAAFYSALLREDYKRAGTWPEDALEVTPEEYDTYTKNDPPAGMRRGSDETGHPAWVETTPVPVATRRNHQLTRIDTAAGAARLRYVSAGQLIEEEYRQALYAVQAWRSANSPADEVPSEIISGAEYSDITYEQAAIEIEQTATSWKGVLAQIRDLRLGGKAAVKAANHDEIESVAASFIERLDAMAPAASA